MTIEWRYTTHHSLGILSLAGYLGPDAVHRFTGAIGWVQARGTGPVILDLTELRGWSAASTSSPSPRPPTNSTAAGGAWNSPQSPPTAVSCPTAPTRRSPSTATCPPPSPPTGTRPGTGGNSAPTSGPARTPAPANA